MGGHHAREIVGVWICERAKMYEICNLLENVKNI